MKILGTLGFILLLSSSPFSATQAAEPYFYDNFDSGDVRTGEQFQWLSSGNVSQEQSVSGQYSRKFSFGPNPIGDDSFSELRFQLAPDANSAPREVWIEYQLRLPLNFIHRADYPANNKLFSIWAENYSRSGDIQAVVEYDRKSSTSSNVRVICMSGRGCLSGNRYSTLFDESMRGQWLQMRFHFKSDQNSGLTEIWRNNELIYSIENYKHYFSGGNNYWRHGYVMGWSNSGFEEVTNFFVDDFKVYTNDPSWGDSPVPPNPPSNFLILE